MHHHCCNHFLKIVSHLSVWATVIGIALGAGAAESITPRWAESLDEALAAAGDDDRPVIVAFVAAWCPVCRQLERQTLPSEEISAVANRFHWTRIELDRGVRLARQYSVAATPTLVVLGPDGAERGRIVGGASPTELAELLRSYAAGTAQAKSHEFMHAELEWTPQGYRGRSICFSHVGYGPLNLSSQSPFQSLRLTMAPRTPSTLGKEEWQVRTGATWANVWANDDSRFDPESGSFGRYLLDYETLHVNAVVAYGLSDTWQVDVAVDNRNRFGGAMDGFIQSFHDTLGIDQSGRDQLPKDDFRILFNPGAGYAPLDLGDDAKGTFSRDVTVSLQHNVTCGTQSLPALAWAISGRWNLEDQDRLNRSGPDVALSVAASRRFGDVYGYVTLGHAWYSSDRVASIPIDDTQLSLLAAAEWRFRPRQSLLIQWLASDGVTDVVDEFSSIANEVTIGWKGEVVTNGVLEIGIIENVATFDNSPDFGVHVAFTQRL